MVEQARATTIAIPSTCAKTVVTPRSRVICTVPLLPGVGWPFQPRGKTHRRIALQTTPRTAHRALRTAHRAPRTVHRTPRIAHPRTRAPRTARHAETQIFFRRLVTIRSSFKYKYLCKYITKGGGIGDKTGDEASAQQGKNKKTR